MIKTLNFWTCVNKMKMFLSELEFLGIEFHFKVRFVSTCYPLRWINCCVWELIFLCTLPFFLWSPIYNSNITRFDAHCKTTGRISRMKCWKRWAFTTCLSFLKEDHPEIPKLIDINFCVGEACIRRFCFIGNLIWVQRVIWMQIPSTFKKGL